MKWANEGISNRAVALYAVCLATLSSAIMLFDHVINGHNPWKSIVPCLGYFGQ
jgi:hypothetical protein